MHAFLHNPVFTSLSSHDRHLGSGNEKVKFFEEEVSPFAGFETGYKKGLDDLYDILPPGRKILHATPEQSIQPGKWQLVQEIKGLQFIFHHSEIANSPSVNLVPLHTIHVAEMVALAMLTKPGPFSSRTIEFGNYYGVFEKGQLVAMTGQRLHAENFTEISAVCTHPGHLGKGYAFALMQHQLNLILNKGQVPFLHVRDDNKRAIDLYERMGFSCSGVMNFFFLEK